MSTNACFLSDHTTASIPVFTRPTTTVLLVEADADAAAEVTAVLAQPGSERFVVRHTALLSEIDAIHAREIDVVLTSTKLPDGVGAAVVEHLRARMPSTPVVVLTDSAERAAVLGSLGAMVCGFVVKERIDRRTLARAFRQARARARYRDLDHCLARPDRMAMLGSLTAAIVHGVGEPAHALARSFKRLSEHVAALQRTHDALRRYLAAAPSGPDREQLAALLESHGDPAVEALAELGAANLADVERITDVLDTIGTMARPPHLPSEYVQINAVVEEACAALRGDLDGRAQLVLELGRVPSIMADQIGLVHAVVNLMRNSLEAFGDRDIEHNRITVTTRHVGDCVQLLIEDTGTGVAPELQRRMLEPFVSSKQPEQGLGLGLPLCAEYVRQHGGELRISSGVSAGTRVEIRLPQHKQLRAIEVAPRPERKPRRRLPERRRQILVIDERRVLTGTVGDSLRAFGDIEFLSSVDEMLHCLSAVHRYDAVVCDLTTPILDAIRLQQMILREAPTIADRVIFCLDEDQLCYRQDWIERLNAPVLYRPVTAAAIRDLVLHLGGLSPTAVASTMYRAREGEWRPHHCH
ncbi:MAG: hypothetical protein Tsb0020_41690 [Haliangiales bacterium]